MIFWLLICQACNLVYIKKIYNSKPKDYNFMLSNPIRLYGYLDWFSWNCLYVYNNKSIFSFLWTGSGSLAAMSVFESGWKPKMSEEEGKKLVRDAIAAGIFNDLGSGSNVDLCVIRNSGPAQYLRTFEEANVKVTLNQ